MSEHTKPKAKVEMGDEQILPPTKPVKDMTDTEKENYRDLLLKKLEDEQTVGGAATIDIVIDTPDFPGTITMRRPTLENQVDIGVKAAKYLRGVAGVDLRTDNLALFFATFDICVEWNSAPEWFKPREMFDYRLLEHIYGRWANWLKSFREFVPPAQEGDSQAS